MRLKWDYLRMEGYWGEKFFGIGGWEKNNLVNGEDSVRGIIEINILEESVLRREC